MFGKPFDDYMQTVFKNIITLYENTITKKRFERRTRQWCVKCAANIKKELKKELFKKVI